MNWTQLLDRQSETQPHEDDLQARVLLVHSNDWKGSLQHNQHSLYCEEVDETDQVWIRKAGARPRWPHGSAQSSSPAIYNPAGRSTFYFFDRPVTQSNEVTHSETRNPSLLRPHEFEIVPFFAEKKKDRDLVKFESHKELENVPAHPQTQIQDLLQTIHSSGFREVDHMHWSTPAIANDTRFGKWTTRCSCSCNRYQRIQDEVRCRSIEVPTQERRGPILQSRHTNVIKQSNTWI